MKIKKPKAHKSVLKKENLNFKTIKTVQKQLKLKMKYTIQKKKLMQIVDRFRSKKHYVFTEKINKIIMMEK